ncbi:MAG: hypothetical protein AABX59_02740 [Nanoarchaeota archaeon]
MKKRGKRKARHTTRHSQSKHGSKIDLLIENNVALQKIMTNLVLETDKLNKRMDRLIHLIEKASDEFVEKGESELKFREIEEEVGMKEKKEKGESKDELIDKLESLLKQNKTIARGLLLLERYVKEKLGGERNPREREFEPLPEFKF